MPIRIKWLGTACFEIRLPNEKTIVIDPYVEDSVSVPFTADAFEGCDFIFITHGHYDHVLDVAKLAERFSPKIFCSETTAAALAKNMGLDPQQMTHITVGDVIREEGLTVEVVQGMHVDFGREYKRMTGRDPDLDAPDAETLIKEGLRVMMGTDRLPPKLGEWLVKYPQGEQLNFVFEPVGGRRIYMAGSYPDERIIDVASRVNAHITLLQVMSGNTIQGLEGQTAKLAIASGCKIVVPQHHDGLFEGAKKTDLSVLKRIISENSDMVFQELVPGEWYDFD